MYIVFIVHLPTYYKFVIVGDKNWLGPPAWHYFFTIGRQHAIVKAETIKKLFARSSYVSNTASSLKFCKAPIS